MPQVDYPPLTTLADYPLHGWDYGKHYACAQDKSQVFDWRCPACVTQAERWPAEMKVVWKLDAQAPPQTVTIGWLVARSRALGVAA